MTEQRLYLCQNCHEKEESTNARPLRILDARFAKSGYVPSDAEVAHLRGILKEEEKELVRYKDEIAVLQCKLEQLEEGKRHLKSNVKWCRSGISVQRRVPAEIWELVFSALCLSLHKYSFNLDYQRNTSFSRERLTVFETPALTVSHVCSRWRSIANDCPRLWSSINIQFAIQRDPVPCLETYLGRSKMQPLSLRLSLDPEKSYALAEDLASDKKKAWQLLALHLGRCRELVIGFHLVEVLPEIRDMILPNLTFYQHLPYVAYSTPESLITDPRQPRWFWRPIRTAPKLTDITLVDFLPVSWLPYRQLTSITIRYLCDLPSVEGLFHVLPICTALNALTLGSWQGPDKPINSIPPVLQRPVEVPSLRYLSLDEACCDIGMDNTLVEVCLPKLNLPGLTTFNVSGWTSTSSDFLRRCSKTLEKLSINLYLGLMLSGERNPASINSVSAALPALSKLSHLDLAIQTSFSRSSATSVIDNFFTTFLSTLKAESDSGSESERTVFLPNLQSAHLTLSDIELSPENVEAVLDAISSRLDTPATTTHRLTRMHLTRHLPYGSGRNPAQVVLDTDVLERVQLLKKEGITVVFDEV
ncbi:hypothetical protein PM082_021769 [Marasmius tenuissimus]|nr:hypothetical protein PM082_021769 [Marasmius tenuissimus]